MLLRKDQMGWAIITIFTIIPILMWVQMEPLSDRFITFAYSFTSIGNVLGLIGVMLYAFTMILGARLMILEDYFGGMNRVYIAHHILGGIAFIVLLLHPLFIATTFAFASVHAAAYFLLPLADIGKTYGIIALYSMMLILIITFFTKLPYQIWRFTHQLIGVSFFVAGLHGIYVSSDMSRNPPLLIYIMTFVTLGLITYFGRTLLGRWLVKRYKYVVNNVYAITNNVVEIEMTPTAETVNFIPGQFVFISFKSPNKKLREAHPFSISSSAAQRELRLTIKALGDFTEQLKTLTHGTVALVEGPFGRFSYMGYKNKDQVWVAGGIGVTPFVSMARSLYYIDFRIDLYYVVHDISEAVYLQELVFIANTNRNLRVIPYYTAQYGRLDAKGIDRMTGNIATKEIFICGPPPMMHSLKNQLKDLHVPARSIHTEEFAML